MYLLEKNSINNIHKPFLSGILQLFKKYIGDEKIKSSVMWFKNFYIK